MPRHLPGRTRKPAIFRSAPAIIPDVPDAVSNRSRFYAELTGFGLTCGFAIASGATMFGGAAAEVPGTGTSTVLIIAAWAGFVTNAAECVTAS
jgi:hypothetical protein